MQYRKLIAIVFIALALVLGLIFYFSLEFPVGLEEYFKAEYYNQFGPIAICVELLTAGLHLFRKHRAANFTLALFGFTAILDPVFTAIGLFTSQVPLYATILFIVCAVVSLWLAISNTFGLGRISWPQLITSFILGVLIELAFNYY